MSESGHTERLETALDGKYRIERKLGEGGMATVYLAEDIKHKRKVALKILRPELAAVIGAERFLSEITTTANLQHPHILALFDSGEAGGYLYYVMPYIDGETLREKLDREKQLGVEEAVRIARDVADALDYAHRAGVIHRDIKPGNILLHDGRPVVADFGIALAVSAAGGGRMTETGLSLGTPHYMSPEQASADRDLSARSDVYSLGCVLYEMIGGQPPHTGPSAQSILVHILTEEAKPLSKLRHTVPPHVAATVAKAIEKLPADRFESAKAFMDALGDEGFVYQARPRDGTSMHETTVAVPAVGGPWKRASMALASVLAITVGALAWSLLRPEPPRLVTRVSVRIPEDQSFAGGPGFLDVSPDGSLFVYVGVGADPSGTQQVWARRMEALDAVPVGGTDGALELDISPDGEEVALRALGNEIRVVPLQGGVARTLVDADGTLCCAAWSPDGAWVYYSEPTLGLRRVPTGGGPSEIVTQVAPADVAHVDPHVLPGGRVVLFRATGESGNRVQAVDVEAGEVKDVIAGFAPRYAASGHLLFVDADGTLLAAPFDVGSAELAGPAVPMVEGLAMTPLGGAYYTVSPSGTLLYRTGAARGSNTPVWVERDGTAREIDAGWVTAGAGNGPSVSLSPTGDRLAISIQDEEGTADLWVKQLDSGPASRLTFEGAQNFRATWSPDGRTLTFSSDRDGNWDVWSKQADGSGTAQLILDREAPIGEAQYSPDGTWLVFREGATAAGQGDIFAIRPGVDSAAVAMTATDFNEYAPTLSPDGRWLAYNSNESGREEVYVIPFPEGRLGGGLVQVSANGGRSPMWANSGRELFYRNAANEMVAVQVSGDPTFAAGEQEVLFSMADHFSNNGHPMYDVSPDDQRFVMLRIGGEQGQDSELVLVQNFFEELRERMGEN